MTNKEFRDYIKKIEMSGSKQFNPENYVVINVSLHGFGTVIRDISGEAPVDSAFGIEVMNRAFEKFCQNVAGIKFGFVSMDMAIFVIKPDDGQNAETAYFGYNSLKLSSGVATSFSAVVRREARKHAIRCGYEAALTPDTMYDMDGISATCYAFSTKPADVVKYIKWYQKSYMSMAYHRMLSNHTDISKLRGTKLVDVKRILSDDYGVDVEGLETKNRRNIWGAAYYKKPGTDAFVFNKSLPDMSSDKNFLNKALGLAEAENRKK